MPTFLHVGCGTKRQDQTPRGFNTPDWRELRLDIDPAVTPDVVGSMLDMAAIASGAVDALFSSHNIEHLYPHETERVLVGTLRASGFASVASRRRAAPCFDLWAVATVAPRDEPAPRALAAPHVPPP